MATNQQTPQTTLAPDEIRLTKALAGIEKAIPPTSNITIGGTSYTQAQLSQLIQGWLDQFAAVQQARRNWLVQVAALHAARPVFRQFLAELRATLIGLFGRGNPELELFGFKPVTPQKRKSSEKALSAAKGELTRQKRGTKGSRQKAAIAPAPTPTLTLGPDGLELAPRGGGPSKP